MSRSMTDAELVNLMAAAPQNFTVSMPDAPAFNAKPGWVIPPSPDLTLNGVPISHVASEVIAVVEQKRAIEAQRDELLMALGNIGNGISSGEENTHLRLIRSMANGAIYRVKGGAA